MIRVSVSRDKRGYRELVSKGHADYAGEGEQDVVCAAVSALIINTVNSLETFTHDRFTAEDRDGFVKLVFTDRQTQEGRLLMDSLLLGLCEISRSYGKKYLQVKIRESDTV
jgi:hypothetical protein